MIQIDKLEQSHAFPTIDFKFQNTGTLTAVLWQFAIEVLEAEINPAPELAFRFGVVEEGSKFSGGFDSSQGALAIYATNNGWGTADNCEVILEEPVLNRFFTEEQRRFIGSIESGETEQVINLSPKGFTVEQFKEYQEIIASFDQSPSLRRRRRRNNYGLEDAETNDTEIPIGELTLKWKAEDAKNRWRAGESFAKGPGHNRELYLTRNGFLCITHWYQLCAMGSDTTYCTIIDPSEGHHERTYPISRMIPPGDVERFHILVGASKSCSLRLRFKFSIDKSKVIISEEFNIEIWNPRDSRLNYLYKDGRQLERRATELNSKSKLKEQERWELEDLESELRRSGRPEDKTSDYPFIDPHKQYRDPWRF